MAKEVNRDEIDGTGQFLVGELALVEIQGSHKGVHQNTRRFLGVILSSKLVGSLNSTKMGHMDLRSRAGHIERQDR